ncbi:EF-hand domain-containing protein [Burkholderia multivorans]|uniref:EF-hand domain-containing protein n=1 Tax=Burkholderia multivorans TaxID=87883 RepID=UPI0009E0C7CA|nr:EF-hand domain-containing protein [Burkholderia multivorans]MBU9162539.1 EF-hand domain-containing protein [Burkholderia multivorans]MBU9412329.1 EF-hand domain-containing protein [Burkholderia multivorans]MBY4794354.1 EF-hand domain-containing protein [Burkholderia multivorans]MCA8250109.1 EF-hand domain-containing protein [Burkholderia multivorans]MCA8504145.1 EF-hand domain-containing protein [Burkholderia multivorans]
MQKRLIVIAAALAAAGVALSAAAFAQASDAAAPARARQAQLGDPYVPPAARRPTAGTQTTGAALHAQVVRKLARQFSAADTQNTGSITEAQARAAGLGYVANHFRQIDASGSGRVSFTDVQRYMQTRSESGQQ